MITEKQRQALQIVKEHGPIRPREFAQFMWPDSPGWRHHSKCGPKGSHRGGGMYLAGGNYLGKLRKQGWIKKEYIHIWGDIWDKGYILTDEGYKVLKDYE